MTRLDHNRAIGQIAAKTGAAVKDITNMTIWGNHSTTQYPDIFQAKVGGESVAAKINDQEWLENDFIPTVQKRGAADHRGAWRIQRRVRRQRRGRPRARLGARHPVR